MFRAAVAFFLIGMLSVLLGAYDLAGFSLGVGKMLLFFFLALSMISLVTSVATRRRIGPL